MPGTWIFLHRCGIPEIVQHFYYPDFERKVIAIRRLQPSDVKHLKRGRPNLADLKYLMNIMEGMARDEGVFWEEDSDISNEAIERFISVVCPKIWSLNVKSKRPQTISWTTYVKYCCKNAL